ncbi:EFR1 family ferrodoxin [Parabacteroides sp. PF5-6]|uniref:EFR1 family ferrodoxin n=1 Tax=Parabacteroides sp. PF5-6 TaxID=1742403 RepID=UPI0024074431|nr:EFR1 family ferrodoxin [Parabacteroides sp. PF5-6]MDF9831619.1 ferredoxin [Parabacteroides sp. PF5-6]
MKINLAYFSATYTTQRIIRQVAAQFGTDAIREYDITQQLPTEEIRLGKDELLILGAPVYSGRIPERAQEAFRYLKGEGTPVVVIAVYGNREYEDALVEMKDLIEANGFRLISAAAFVAQHSIFSHVATGRPDAKDMRLAAEYGKQLAALLDNAEAIEALPLPAIKGNRPYRDIGPSHPMPIRVEEECNACGTCVELCPYQAISAADPRVTDVAQCRSCGRCIVVCPLQVRRFSGEFFDMVGQKFAVALAARKEPELFF